MRKGLALVLASSLLLAACGTSEVAVESTPKKEAPVAEVQSELAAQNEQFRTYANAQMTEFVADAQLLAAQIHDGKLAEAQKLYPLVAMYEERIAPLQGAVTTSISGDFTALAKGLYTDKNTASIKEAATTFVKHVETLATEIAKADVKDYSVVNAAQQHVSNMLANRLTTNTPADDEVYRLQAMREMLDEIVKIYMAKADAIKAGEVVQATAALKEVLAFYAIGKEDYIKYSLFTNAQKEELTTAVTNVKQAFDAMLATM